MAKDNKNSSKKPKISPYWIYGAVIVIFISINLFSGGFGGSDGKQTTPTQFFNYLQNGDVEKIEIINKKIAKVYLTKDAKDKEEHKASKPSSILPSVAPLPNYTFEFGDLKLFQEEIEKVKAANGLNTSVGFVTETNMFGELISLFLPIILIIAVWIFIMRRMSGGAGGGGAGGQLFNIGKSKAKLFDEKIDTKTTFKDVAGLEGAKEEVQEIVDFLKFPEKYTALGGKIPKGALLVGPPGTGKTLTAKIKPNLY